MKFSYRYLPGRASRFFDRMSLHGLHTRTGDVQPLAGTGIRCIEHGLQNPSPQPRQWCLCRPVRSKCILQPWQCYR